MARSGHLHVLFFLHLETVAVSLAGVPRGPLPHPLSPLYPKSNRGPLVRARKFDATQRRRHENFSIAIFALAFVVSVVTMFAPIRRHVGLRVRRAAASGARGYPPVRPTRIRPHAASLAPPGNILARRSPTAWARLDWFPGEHPQMPDVVAHGKQPNVWACGYAIQRQAARRMRASTACPSNISSTR